MKNIHSFEVLMKELSPALKKMEQERRLLKKKATRRSFWWCVGILAIAVPATIFLQLEFGGIILFVFILLLIITLFIFQSLGRPLSEYYKKEIIGRMVEALVENGRYSPNQGISETTFNESNLFIRPDRYDSEDLISGMIDKTSFLFAEIHAEEKQSNGKSTHWVTIFKGFFFIADFHKNFTGRTVVSRNSFFKWKSGRVKLENVEFEKRFDVFSTDQLEARYLLTPSMMERIIALDDRLGGDIVLSFYNSNVIIAISSSTNHFESSLWSSIDNTDKLQREYNLISSMISIVEELNLNTRIWSKE